MFNFFSSTSLHRANRYVITLGCVIAGIICAGSMILAATLLMNPGTTALLPEFLAESTWHLLVLISACAGLITSVLLALTLHYRTDLPRLHLQAILNELGPIVIAAMRATLNGVLRSTPRASNLQAMTAWIKEEFPELKKEVNAIAAMIAVTFEEAAEGLSGKDLDDLDRNLLTAEENAKEVAAINQELRKRLEMLTPRARAVSMLGEQNTAEAKAMLAEVQEILQILQGDTNSNVTPFRPQSGD